MVQGNLTIEKRAMTVISFDDFLKSQLCNLRGGEEDEGEEKASLGSLSRSHFYANVRRLFGIIKSGFYCLFPSLMFGKVT